jgi:chromosome partitioning protein
MAPKRHDAKTPDLECVMASCNHGVMKVVAFLSQKGGAGKTTLAVHTAVAAYETGLGVVLIDTDPQKSATVWGEARQEPGPVVATADVSDLRRVLDAARSDGMGLAIIDAAPHAAPAAASIARAADLIAIPCKAVFVLSACPFRAPEIAETRDALNAFGLPVAPVEITDRRAFARAVASGRAVTEFETDGKAAGEIRALWSWLQEQMA